MKYTANKNNFDNTIMSAKISQKENYNKLRHNEMMGKLEAVELWFVRRMLTIPWTEKNVNAKVL